MALDNAPTLDPEAARKDVELDKAISSIVMGKFMIPFTLFVLRAFRLCW